MKTLLNMIKDRASKNSSSRSHYGTDDDSNQGTSSSTSSHNSEASSRAARRSRSNTQPTKQSKQCFSHALPMPKVPVVGNGFGSPHPSQSTPSLAIPKPSPQLPKSPSRLKTRQFAQSESADNAHEGYSHSNRTPSRDDGQTHHIPSEADEGIVLSPTRRGVQRNGSAAQLREYREPVSATNTIRPCRSFRDNTLGSLAVLKDRFAVSSSSFLHPDDSVDLASPKRRRFDDEDMDLHMSSEGGMSAGSTFSDMTVVTAAEQANGVRLVSHGSAIDLSYKDAISNSFTSSRNPRCSIEDTVSQYKRMQAENLQKPPSPAPNVAAPRPSSRSRARTVLQRLRRPLTAGSRKPEEPFNLAAMNRPQGFGFNQTAAAPTSGSTDLSGEEGFASAVTPRHNAGQASSFDFDPSIRSLQGDLPSPASATFTSTSLHPPAQVNDEVSTMELSGLINELIATHSHPTLSAPEDISAKASRIISWAEHVASRERRPSASHGVVSGGPRSLGPRGLGISSSGLLRSIDYLEMLVQTQLSRGGQSMEDCHNVVAAFHYAKDLCTPIAAPTTPVASELPSETFHTGLSVAMMPNRRQGSISVDGPSDLFSAAGNLPLTPPNMLNPLAPKDEQHKVSPASRFDMYGATTAPLSPVSITSTPNPSVAAAEKTLASLATPPEPRKTTDSVSPFESQLSETSGKGATVSLTPAPRRRRRPTTAPETSGNGGAHAFGAAMGRTSAAAREGLRNVLDKSPQLPSPKVADVGQENMKRSASNLQAPKGITANQTNRRSMMHQPSLSYPGQNAGDADGEDGLDGGQLELLRSNSPFNPIHTYQHHHPLSNHALSQHERGGGEMTGGGGLRARIGGMNQSRPNTATSVATVTGSRSGPNTPQEIFTPESFRAGPRPSSRSASSNNATPYLRSDANASQKSLANSVASSQHAPASSSSSSSGPGSSGSNHNGAGLSPALPINGMGAGLGIRMGENGKFVNASSASIRSKPSKASVKDLDPQQHGYADSVSPLDVKEAASAGRFVVGGSNELYQLSVAKGSRGFRKASKKTTAAMS
ncbi:hypothetical protein CF319_g5360 [Tilletia indica]|nr:hypothetical protein CF319_g5360 [Tilletia indica]KAE8233314.1 hypothetical protein CF326_g1645 [Tilletia indica]